MHASLARALAASCASNRIILRESLTGLAARSSEGVRKRHGSFLADPSLEEVRKVDGERRTIKAGLLRAAVLARLTGHGTSMLASPPPAVTCRVSSAVN
ncbi:hypothetical protein FHS87_004398 [Roseomonas pecuniae]|uniref:Uncharacterized protein n=1 Tax=Muricoccus pecuniae TaxID=693023 RepID=A0A840YIH4_9PROT|nr:hypothetical protein [Roseomonas pecuniae]